MILIKHHLDKYNLTPREFDYIGFAMEGLSILEIGEKMFISDKGVKQHNTSVLRKLGMSSRYTLIVYLYKLVCQELQTTKKEIKENYMELLERRVIDPILNNEKNLRDMEASLEQEQLPQGFKKCWE